MTWRDASGRQHKRSTRIEHTPGASTARERAKLASENRRAALLLANGVEAAERGNPTEAHLRKLMAELSERLCGSRIEAPTVRAYLEQWLDTRRLTPSTRLRYAKPIKDFCEHLGRRADSPIDAITPADVNAFITARLKVVGATTANADLKPIGAAFAQALRSGLVQLNPVAAAGKVESAMEERQPFTRGEVDSLLRSAAGTDWATAIYLGAFAGLRLGDATNLDWSCVDLFAGTLTFRPRKTARKKRDLIIPIAPPLKAHLLTLERPQSGKGPLTPTLAGRSAGGKSGLSMAFARLMERAGIDAGKADIDAGQARALSRKSFHSLRHTFVATLAAAGVAPDVRMALAGHSTQGAHGRYSHLQLETLERAVAKL